MTGAPRETLCVRLGVSGVPERTKHDADGADETRQPAQQREAIRHLGARALARWNVPHELRGGRTSPAAQ